MFRYLLQDTCEADQEFSYRVTEAVMRGYVEQTWGRWEPSEQHARHAKSFDVQSHRIVVVAGARVGILAVREYPSYVQLEKLYLLPEAQNQGVGALLLQSVVMQASKAGKPVRLRVLKVNTSAQRFYQRHGLFVTDTTEERCFMETGA